MARGLRVLFVNENLGGHAAMHLHLRRALARHPEVDADFVDVPAPRLVRRIAAVPVPFLARPDLDLQPLRYKLAQSLHTRRLLRSHGGRYDVLHAYTQSTVLGLSGLLARAPSVVSTDCTNLQGAALLPYRRAAAGTAARVRLSRVFEDPVYRAATMVVGQSEWAAASLRDDYGVAEEKLHVIPFGVTVEAAPARSADPRRPEITFIGSSLERKGGYRLLRAFRRRLRGRCVLNLITHERVAPEPGVRLYGDLVAGDPRLPGILARTSVFAFPSEIDCSPYSVLEAMHAGVPVVAVRQGGVPEMVVDGETGLVVEPDDDALLGALEALLDDPGRAEEMGRSGRQRLEDRFDARRTTRDLVAVLHAAGNAHDGPLAH